MSNESTTGPAGWKCVSLGMLMAETPGIIPANSPETVFQLWSVPAFDTGKPEIQSGAAVGSNKQVVQPQDVLLCKINPRINRVWVVGDGEGLRQIASTEWIVLRSKHVDPRFLMHRLREASIRETLTSNVSGVGGSLTRVRPQVVADIEIGLPPLPEQRRIADRIEELQVRSRASRRALESIPPMLEWFRKSVLAAAFRGDLTADWRAHNPSTETGSTLLEQLRADRPRQGAAAELTNRSSIGKRSNAEASSKKYPHIEPLTRDGLPPLPATWTWAAAEELTGFNRPIIYGIIKPGPDTPGGVPYVRVTEMKGGTIDIHELRRCAPERAAMFARATLHAGDVLISKDGTIGKVAIVPPELDGGNITQHVLRFSPAPGISSVYLSRAIEAPGAQRWITEGLKGIGLQGINVGDFRRLPIPLPPAAEQVVLAERVDAMLKQISAVDALRESAEAESTRLDQSILAKAFRGELVPQDPNDEPASVLLERIRGERDAAGGAKRRGRKGAAR